MKKNFQLTIIILLLSLALVPAAFSFWDKLPFVGNGVTLLTPENGIIKLPLQKINDGAAHHFKVRAADGLLVPFFAIRSSDGVIRAAIDACDVCYRSGQGYVQEGDYMVCRNCGQRFASDKINVIKGGCNPAPLARRIEGDNLIIAMQDINTNSWYAKYRQQ